MTETTNPKQLVDAIANAALMIEAIAQHAGAIAHARRSLYQAYVAEGFSEAQALELCKSLPFF